MTAPSEYMQHAIIFSAKAMFGSMFAHGASMQQVQALAGKLQTSIVNALQESALEATLVQQAPTSMHQPIEPEQQPPEDGNPFE